MLKLAAQPHSFRDSDGKPLLSPSTFNFQSTGQTLPGGEHAFSLATTFASLSLGLKPWWGKGDGDIHMTYAPWPLKALRRAIFRSITGTALERLEAKGYRSLNTNSFTLQIDRPWMLDGETLPVHASSPLQVSTTRPLTFLR